MSSSGRSLASSTPDPRLALPFLSRGTTPVLDNPANAAFANLAGIEQVVYDAATGLYWGVCNATSAISVQGCRFVNAATPDGPFTDAGAVPGLPTAFDAPCIVRDGVNWYIFGGVSGAGQVITCYRSTTGINGTYTSLGTAIPVGTTGAWDVSRTMEPWVMRNPFGTGWLMFYMGFDTGNAHEQVGYATAASVEGPWTKYASNPVLANANPVAPNVAANQSAVAARDVDGDICADPYAVVVYPNGVKTLLLFYAAAPTGFVANTNGYSTISVATTTDLVTFTKQGSVLEPGGLANGAPDCNGVWRGSMLWAEDDVIRMYFQGRKRQGATTQTYLAKIDATRLAVPRNRWIRLEAETADPRIILPAGVLSAASALWSNGNVRYSQTTADRFTFYFEGTGCRWGAGTNPGYGMANVYLDGTKVVSNADFYGADATTMKVLGYEATGLKAGFHKLEVEVTGSKNAASTGTIVVCDYFEYLPSFTGP